MRLAPNSCPKLSVLTTNLSDNARNIASHIPDCASPKLERPATRRRAAHSLQTIQLAIVVPLAVWIVASAGTQTLRAERWVNGPEFVARLDAQVSGTWHDTPLGDALRRLGASQSVAVFIDRRVDPSVKVSIDIHDVSLREAFRQIARQQHQKLGIGFCGPVVYIGPPLTTARLATLAERNNERAAKLPMETRKRMLSKRELEWPRLSEPRWIVRKLCAESGLEFPTAKTIPHDLWAAGDYPRMTMAERLTLVLAGFGYNYRIEAEEKRMQLTSFPPAVAIQRSYDLSPGSPKLEAIADRFPQATVEQAGGQATIRSTLEDHWSIERMLGIRRPAPLRNADPSHQRFTLNVKDKPLKTVVDLIAQRLNVEVTFAAGIDAQDQMQRVSFSVQDATRQQLFDAIVDPAGLAAQLRGNQLRIKRKR